MSLYDEIKRETRDSGQDMLFEMEPDWKQHWWDMPDFEMGDARPQHRLVVNFMTYEDLNAFSSLLNTQLNKTTSSIWYPLQERLQGGVYKYDGPVVMNKYPICLPSKGRYDCQTTGKLLDEMGLPYKFFVEETEGDLYKEHLGEDKVVVMPFHDLGKGSIPARNFLWQWSKEREFKRHWCMDDNITNFTRAHMNRRIRVIGGGFFKAMEDFVDRYENIALAGPHEQGFVPDREPNTTPFLLNSRVYSCILINTDLELEERWRGRYNEDTDLSLRLLKMGYCTVLFRALLMAKGTTHIGGNSTKGAMKGGNTDNVYNTNDYRKSFAESLRDQHPDVVEVTWKFGRWHHEVDYSPFKKNALILKKNITPIRTINNYGMELVKLIENVEPTAKVEVVVKESEPTIDSSKLDEFEKQLKDMLNQIQTIKRGENENLKS